MQRGQISRIFSVKVWGVALSSCGDSSDVILGVCMRCGEVSDSLGTGPWCSSTHAIQVR